MGEVTEVWREGDTAVVRVTWTDPDNTAAPVGPDGHTLFDPTTVSAKSMSPTGSQAAVGLTKESQGVYRGRQLLSPSGEWWFQFNASGTGYSRVVEFALPVIDSRFS